MYNEGCTSNISEISVSTIRDYCCNESDKTACCIYTPWSNLSSLVRLPCRWLEDSCQSGSESSKTMKIQVSSDTLLCNWTSGSRCSKEHRVVKMLGTTHPITQLHILEDLQKQWHEDLNWHHKQCCSAWALWDRSSTIMSIASLCPLFLKCSMSEPGHELCHLLHQPLMTVIVPETMNMHNSLPDIFLVCGHLSYSSAASWTSLRNSSTPTPVRADTPTHRKLL